MSDDSNFYEDDEPIEKIMAILEREPDGVTVPPGRRRTEARMKEEAMTMATDRQYHSEKISIYLDTDLLVAITDAISSLRRKGIRVDRGRFVREAVAYVLNLDPESKAVFKDRLSR